MFRELKREAGWAGRAALRKARSLVRSRSAVERRFASYFADVPVDLDGLRDYKIEYFPASGPEPWLDGEGAETLIAQRVAAGGISEEQGQACRQWAQNGVLVLPKFFDETLLDETWAAYDQAVRDGKVRLQPEEPAAGDPLPSRSLDAHFAVPAIRNILRDERLKRWMRLLLGREPVAFQTLVSHKGSEQREHSDAVHMTTYPLGYLTAAWIAFEDIDPDCGPIVYYPGSHRLPYLSSLSLGISSRDFRRRGYAAYSERYEPAIQRTIAANRLEPAVFLPRKGDVLLWHGNLIHAGSPRRNLSLSRKAVVLHFFARGAVCYHDLSGTLTPMDRLA
jgi:hypothetical protein